MCGVPQGDTGYSYQGPDGTVYQGLGPRSSPQTWAVIERGTHCTHSLLRYLHVASFFGLFAEAPEGGRGLVRCAVTPDTGVGVRWAGSHGAHTAVVSVRF